VLGLDRLGHGGEELVEQLDAPGQLAELRAHPVARRVRAIAEREPVAATLLLAELGCSRRDEHASQGSEVVCGQVELDPRHGSTDLGCVAGLAGEIELHGATMHGAMPAAQQQAVRTRRDGVRFIPVLKPVACTLGLTTMLLGCLRPADAPIPPGYEALVESARFGVLAHYEGLVRPALAVTEIRCFADGGVVILFRQVGGPTPGEPAFAMGGQAPVAPEPYAWSGGYGRLDEIEAEIAFNHGGDDVIRCPPRVS
jgi:hypothetical protein